MSQAKDVPVLLNYAGIATRVFEQMREGVEDITTDAFADESVRNFKVNAKAVEAEKAKIAHQPKARSN